MRLLHGMQTNADVFAASFPAVTGKAGAKYPQYGALTLEADVSINSSHLTPHGMIHLQAAAPTSDRQCPHVSQPVSQSWGFRYADTTAKSGAVLQLEVRQE